MSSGLDTDVLVVGAGPTGLLAALKLAEAGLSVEVVEEEWRAAGHSYALALHPRSLRLLDELGLAEAAIEQGRRLGGVALHEGGRRQGRLDFARPGARFPFLLALPQSALEGLLAGRLAERGVKVRWSHRLAGIESDASGVEARVERLEKVSTGYAVAHTEWAVEKVLAFRARYVVGADGHRSLVRRALSASFDEVAPSQAFAVAECAAGPGDDMQLVLDERTVSALWPLPGERARWSFELEAPEVSAWDRFKSRLTTMVGERPYPGLDEERVVGLVRERAPWFERDLRDVGWSIEVRFERRLASTFGRGRVWLAGDAAHLTGPLGMQSMNAGLAEAALLASSLRRVLRGGEAATLLEGYGRERLAEWRFLLGLEGGLQASASAPPWAAAVAGRLLPCLPATGEELLEMVGQVGLGRQ